MNSNLKPTTSHTQSSTTAPCFLVGVLLTVVIAIVSATSVFAQTDRAGTRTISRYQISAYVYGGPRTSGHGCYIVDTWTGELWISQGGALKKLSEAIE